MNALEVKRLDAGAPARSASPTLVVHVARLGLIGVASAAVEASPGFEELDLLISKAAGQRAGLTVDSPVEFILISW